MRTSNRLGAIAAAALVASMAGAAMASDADTARQTRDREEISALMWRYVRALDGMDPDAYAAVFTPDGAFGDTKGSAALKEMIVGFQKNRAEREAKGQKQGEMYHVDYNQYVEFVDRDHARVHYYWMTAFSGATRADPPRVAAVGRGVDDIVRVGGKWLIKMRNVAPKGD